MAIAGATLQHLVQDVKCKTLFITHYPLVATKLSKKYPRDVQNLHMSYDADVGIDRIRRITFLYKLIPGLATGRLSDSSLQHHSDSHFSESFGIECGRLAKVPEDILAVAVDKSSHMQEEVQKRIKRNRSLDHINLSLRVLTIPSTRLLKAARQIQLCLESSGIMRDIALEDLRSTMESLRIEDNNL